jgi:acetolactate synthase I/II/III large subunit
MNGDTQVKTRVADYVAKTIVERGIRQVFLLSGGGMMHLLDGLALNKDLSLVFHHHEQCAGIAAEACARMTGKPSFCFATSGPGATNIVTAMAGAWLDSSPVVFVTGQSKTVQTIRHSRIEGLRQFGAFEVDIIEIVKSIAKFTWFLDKPEDTPFVLDKACSVAASGRPGPVLIDIPVDVQGAYFIPDGCRRHQPAPEAVRPEIDSFERILSRWESASRPLILAGNGVAISRQGSQLMEIARMKETPVATTQMGKDAVPYHDEYWVGHPGIKGDRTGNFAIQNADFILAVGASLHVFTTGYELDKFAPDAWIAQVDLDTAIFERECVLVDAKCRADVKSFLQETASHHKLRTYDQTRMSWRKGLLALKSRFEVYKEPHKTEEGQVNMYKVLQAFNEQSTDRDIIVADAGSAFYTVGQAWKVQDGQRVLISGALGSMGWAIPAATGAAVAAKGRRVLCFTGDGSAQTNLHELAVISKNRLNVKLVIFNNGGYLSIKNTQDNYFKGNYAGVGASSGVFIPSLRAAAALFEIDYLHAENEAQLTSVITTAFQKNGPVLIEVPTNINQEIIPGVGSMKREDGTMVSTSLDRMQPLLDEAEHKKIIELIRP